MMHAVLTVSAQHLSNFARAFNNVDKTISFNEQAAHHRSEALYLLRVSGSGSEESTNEALLPSVTLLLTLGALLKGDSDIIPLFLDQTQAYLAAIEHPSSAPHLPTISAIYSIYRALQAVASSEQLDLSQVFAVHEPSDTWIRVADETVERLVGIVSPFLTHATDCSPARCSSSLRASITSCSSGVPSMMPSRGWRCAPSAR